MKIIFCTNLPSPYRVDFFNEFGKYCDLTVLYERHSSAERDESWKGDNAINFKEVYLNLRPVGIDRAKGSALKEYVKSHPSDKLIFTNYVSPSTFIAILWCRLHHRPYFIEYDGGFNKKDSFIKGLLKKFLLRGAVGHLTTANEHITYLMSLGISKSKIFKYPFTSVRERDIVEINSISKEQKSEIKRRLEIKENKVLLSVGRFSYERGYGKGYDLLLQVAENCPHDIGIYIVGDEPTEEFKRIKREKELKNVHFVGFRSKKELSEYYLAADLFVLLSRGDVWGLVVNEAMSFGLPVISSNKCIAGLELVDEGKNGFIVDLGNVSNITKKIMKIMEDNQLRSNMERNSLLIIGKFTIEAMALAHKEILISH